MNNKPGIEQKVARTILRYLQEHPDAKDTLEGIAQWWLLKDVVEWMLADVERALSVLLAEDLIVVTQREGLAKYYGLNHERQKQIVEFLKQ